MKGIRKQLGLGSTANTFASGKSFLPLTRQEVREIIDANITAINEHRGLLDQIQSQSEKYNGLSTEERQNRVKTRNDINNENKQIASISYNPDLRFSLALLSKCDFKDFTDDKLYSTSLISDDLADCIEELNENDSLDVWQQQNESGAHFLRLSESVQVGIDHKTNYVLFRTAMNGKEFTLSTGMTAQKALQCISNSIDKLTGSRA